MTKKEYQIQQVRVMKFYSRLSEYFLEDARIFEGEIAVSNEPVTYNQRQHLKYETISEGMLWGKLWDSAWIHLQGECPAAWKDREVIFQLNVGGEGLLFDAQGVPFYSITNTSSQAKHYRKEYVQYGICSGTGKFDLWIEAAANGLFGREEDPDYPDQHGDFGLIRKLRYGLFRREVWALALDLEVLMSLLHFPHTAGDFGFPKTPAFPEGSAREKQLMRILSRAVDCFAGNPENATAARAILAEALQTPASASAMTVTAVGHAHIDTGWLWPVRESVRKAARTFASQLTLMERYPDYVFGASQPQHYLFIKENYPALYEKIKQRVAEGRWELQGGMWVECDCNLASGEAIIRQFLHGKNFFHDEFGIEVKNLWLPDVFGYSAALPQIIRKCGCDRFLTQKLSWNQNNKFPHHCFRWIGIDGTPILSFFPPEDNYNATLEPEMLNYGVNNFSENDMIPESISLFGIGDGGGGPKEEYLERGIRCANLEGVPKVRFGRADEFLERLSKYEESLPAWHGELYLELHRGTLTTQAEVKRNNRRCEEMLLAVEKVYAGRDLKEYPTRELDRLWKLLLLNQFHDILPGSSIALVYERTRKEHQDILESCNKLIAALANDTECVTFVNTLGIPYHGLVALPESWEGTEELASQQTADGKYYVSLTLAPHQNRVLNRKDNRKAISQTPVPVLENKLVRAEFSNTGELVSLIEKSSNREMLSAPANIFKLYHDRPNANDAWDIDAFYMNEELTEACCCTQITPVTTGALWAELSFEFAVGSSTVQQTVQLMHDTKRLEFHTSVMWNEKHKLLRVEFPTSIHNGKANFDIQYGFLERPIHRNTSWDEAKFEVCMHQYCDLADATGGLALLNDCKYGGSVHENIIGMSLLRAPTYPDATADRGKQEFTYALMPHTGDFREAGVREAAASLNRPPLMIAGDLSAWKLPMEVKNITGSVVVETVKRAEKEDALVLRCVERHGRIGRCRIHVAIPWRTITEYDLLEWNPVGECAESGAEFSFKPFEIKTFLIKK